MLTIVDDTTQILMRNCDAFRKKELIFKKIAFKKKKSLSKLTKRLILLSLLCLSLSKLTLQSAVQADDDHSDEAPNSRTTKPTNQTNPLTCYVCQSLEIGSCRFMKPISSATFHEYPSNLSMTLPPYSPNELDTTTAEPTKQTPSEQLRESGNTTNHSQHDQPGYNQFYNETSWYYHYSNPSFPSPTTFLMKGSKIGARTCSKDENFCSVMSIENIEFIDNNFVSKFWSLARNCSKRCYRGCFVIGERVKIRICNHCCTTPNCNVNHSNMLTPSSLIYTLSILIISQQIHYLTTAATKTKTTSTLFRPL